MCIICHFLTVLLFGCLLLASAAPVKKVDVNEMKTSRTNSSLSVESQDALYNLASAVAYSAFLNADQDNVEKLGNSVSEVESIIPEAAFGELAGNKNNTTTVADAVASMILALTFPGPQNFGSDPALSANVLRQDARSKNIV